MFRERSRVARGDVKITRKVTLYTQYATKFE
jgi:hypothetical protein